MPALRPFVPAALVCAIVLVSCSKSDSGGRTDSTTATGATKTSTAVSSNGAAATATPLSLADLAGTWHMRSTPEGGADTSSTEYTLTAAGTSSGWKVTFAKGPTVPVRVSTAGDSLVADIGPYASVRRKGMQVTTHGVYRKDGDKLVGRVTAHYATKGADSVLVLRSEGTRAP
jgi:hypothetical protein